MKLIKKIQTRINRNRTAKQFAKDYALRVKLAERYAKEDAQTAQASFLAATSNGAAWDAVSELEDFLVASEYAANNPQLMSYPTWN